MPDVMDISREQIFSEVSALVAPGTVVRSHEPLASRTTLRVGGPADVFVEPASEGDLAAILKFCRNADVPFLVLGRGSNLLVKDGGVRGVVISLAHQAFSTISVEGQSLHCGAGARLKAVSAQARKSLLTGLEFLEGIPGTVGGALRMNAGAMGSATFDFVVSVRFMDLDGEVHELPGSKMGAQYRVCPLLKENIALGAVFQGAPSDAATIREKSNRFNEKRWDSQPAQPSAGCIFKNPSTIPSGKLVEELGLKGLRIGGASVSVVHGNFIVNEGKASAVEVLELIAQIKARARAERGIELETEVEIIGEDA